ncbi:MAG: hypothetical protein JSR81_04320 [Proteobacteria bacterium]|nr:hypothetical protein [Pseudomonadota bacterium]
MTRFLQKTANIPKSAVLGIWFAAILCLAAIFVTGRLKYLADYTLPPSHEQPYELFFAIAIPVMAYMLLRNYLWGPFAGHFANVWGIYLFFLLSVALLLTAFLLLNGTLHLIVMGGIGAAFLLLVYKYNFKTMT